MLDELAADLATALAEFAALPNALDSMTAIFGASADVASWVEKWGSGQPGRTLAVRLCPARSLSGRAGAYVRQSDTLLLATELLSADTPPGLRLRVLLEEYGHALDARMNVVETPGDEGAAFAHAVLGWPPEPAHARDDYAALWLDGALVGAELTSVKIDPVTGRAVVGDYVVDPPANPNGDTPSHTAFDTITLGATGRYDLYLSTTDNGLSDYEVDVYEGPRAGMGSLIGQLTYGQVGEQKRIYGFLGTDGSEVLNIGGFGTFFSPPGVIQYNSVNSGQIISLVARDYAQSYTTIGITLRAVYASEQGPMAGDFSVKLSQLHGSVTADPLSHVSGDFPIYPSTLTITAQGKYGTAQIVDGKIVYTENQDLTVPIKDDIKYQVTDTAGQLSNIGDIHVKVGPDPYPLNVDADATVSGDGTTAAAIASQGSPIQLGRQDGLNDLIRTVVGSTVYSDASVMVMGTMFTPVVGNLEGIIFQGDANFLASTQTATLTDSNLVTDGNGLKVAGEVFNSTSIKLDKQQIELTGFFSLPSELPVPRVNVVGGNTLQISADGAAFSSPVAIPQATAEFSFKSALRIQGTQLLATYDAGLDQLKLQGTLTIDSPVQAAGLPLTTNPTTAIVNLSGDNYILVKGDEVDLKGTLSLNDLRPFPGLTVSASISLETEGTKVKSFGGTGKIVFGEALGVKDLGVEAGLAFKDVDDAYYLNTASLKIAYQVPFPNGLVFQSGSITVDGLAPLPKGATSDPMPTSLTVAVEVSEGPKETIHVPTSFTTSTNIDVALSDTTISGTFGRDKSNGDFIGGAKIAGWFGFASFASISVAGAGFDFSNYDGDLTGNISLLGALSGTLAAHYKDAIENFSGTVMGNLPNLPIFGGYAGKALAASQVLLHVDLANADNDVLDLTASIPGFNETLQWRLSDLENGDIIPTRLALAPLTTTTTSSATPKVTESADVAARPFAERLAATAHPSAVSADDSTSSSTAYVLTQGGSIVLSVDWTNASPDSSPGDPGTVNGASLSDGSDQSFQVPLEVTYTPADGSPVMTFRGDYIDANDTFHPGNFGDANISYVDDLSSNFTRTVNVGFAPPGTYSVAIDYDAIQAMGIDPSSLDLGTITTDATIPVNNQPVFSITGTFVDGDGNLHVTYSATSGDGVATFQIYADPTPGDYNGVLVTTIQGPATNTTVNGDFARGAAEHRRQPLRPGRPAIPLRRSRHHGRGAGPHPLFHSHPARRHRRPPGREYVAAAASRVRPRDLGGRDGHQCQQRRGA